MLVDTIEVLSNHTRKDGVGSGAHVFSSNDLETSSTLSKLLTESSTIHIRSIGPSGSATSAFRGAAGNHTLVLWNGIALTHPQLGLYDLSLMPSSFIDKAIITKGGNASIWGSGAIGGVINSSSTLNFDEGFSTSVNTKYGSFNEVSLAGGFSLSNEKWAFRSRILNASSDNDYKYFNTKYQVGGKVKHAVRFERAVLSSLAYSFNTNNILSLHYWKQTGKKEFPARLDQTRSEAYQEDRFDRVLLNFNSVGTKSILEMKVAFLNEDLDYFDPSILLESISNFKSLITDIHNDWQLGDDFRLGVGVNMTNNWIESTTLNESITERKMAMFSSIQYAKNNSRVQLNSRIEYINKSFIPPVFSIGFDHILYKNISFRSKLSKNFRSTTINERFYKPGGNPELKPESGWSEELGIDYHSEINNQSLDFSFTIYNRKIKNWVLWTLEPDQNFVSASNLAKVWSRGIEIDGSYKKSFNKWSYEFGSSLNFVKSTNEVAVNFPRIEKGEQLVYTPEIKSTVYVQVDFGSFDFLFSHMFVSDQEGINDKLEKFNTSKISLSYQYRIKKLSGQFRFNIQNLFDHYYELSELYPMPPRNFNIQLSINFNK